MRNHAPLLFLPALAAVLTILAPRSLGAASEPFPDASQLPIQAGLPNPLVMFNGDPVTSKEMWLEKRRPELKALFQHYMYGYMPPAPANLKWKIEREDKTLFGGKATKREVTLRFGPPNAPAIHLLVVIPNRREGPAPVFVGPNFCGNFTLLEDPTIPIPTGWMLSGCPGCSNNQASEAGRGKQAEVWAIEQSIDRGYAVATFYNGDIDPDRPNFEEGIHPFYLKPGQKEPASTDWGTIAAWAWGISRAVDYLVQDGEIDRRRIAVVGHSRNGKTALLAAAFDERIALAIPLQAGCGGTAPSRGKIGESVQRINTSFPHWFNGEFKKFNEMPERLPFDQNCLIALVAPRPILLANAAEDTWANPAGQFEALRAAEPVYRLLGSGGLDAKEMPPLETLVSSPLGFYIRPGKHSMTKADWKIFLDYADKRLKPAGSKR